MGFLLPLTSGWVGEGRWETIVMSFPGSRLQRPGGAADLVQCVYSLVYMQTLPISSGHIKSLFNQSKQHAIRGVGGAVRPGSVSADKRQEAGNALSLGAKLEGLQLAGTPS